MNINQPVTDASKAPRTVPAERPIAIHTSQPYVATDEMDTVIEQRNQYKAQRDELLAALKGVVDYTLSHTDPQSWADQYRNDIHARRDLVAAVDAIAKTERRAQ